MMATAQVSAPKPVNCRPGEVVAETGNYFCYMCAENGPIGHVSLSRGVINRTITRKRFNAGEKFDSSCPEHGTATGWTIEEFSVCNELGEALFEATRVCDPDIVSALIDMGADVHARKSDGSTALISAASTGCLEIVNVLIQRGADVNARKCDGTTALMNATRIGREDLVCTLLAAGADVNMRKNDSGTAALEIAASHGHGAIVRALLEKGANVGAMNYAGQTAETCAYQHGHAEIVALLKTLSACSPGGSD